jgi:hypothetical protein
MGRCSQPGIAIAAGVAGEAWMAGEAVLGQPEWVAAMEAAPSPLLSGGARRWSSSSSAASQQDIARPQRASSA